MFELIILWFGTILVHFLDTIDTILGFLISKFKRSKQKPLSIVVDEKCGEYGETRRSMLGPNAELVTTPIPGIYTLHELFQNAVKKYGDRPCQGQRGIIQIHKQVIELDDGRKKIWKIPEFGQVKWRTYSQVYQRIIDFGSGLIHLTGMKFGSLFGIYEETRPEWMIVAQACFLHGFPVVTIYSNLGEDALIQAIQETEVTCMLVNGKFVNKLLTLSSKFPKLKYLIYTDDLPRNVKISKSTEHNIKLVSYDDVCTLGKLYPKEANPKPSKDDLALIMYTSGSTGMPKGVMISHKNLVCGVASGLYAVGGVKPSDIYLAYLPLAHVSFMIIHSFERH